MVVPVFNGPGWGFIYCGNGFQHKNMPSWFTVDFKIQIFSLTALKDLFPFHLQTLVQDTRFLPWNWLEISFSLRNRLNFCWVQSTLTSISCVYLLTDQTACSPWWERPTISLQSWWTLPSTVFRENWRVSSTTPWLLSRRALHKVPLKEVKPRLKISFAHLWTVCSYR